MVAVGVPAAGIVDRHVRDAGFHQPTGDQAFLAEGVAAVTISQVGLLLREVEDLLALAQDQLVGAGLRLAGGLQFGIAGKCPAHGVQAAEQVAAGPLAVVGDPPRDHALDLEPGGVRVAAGGERLVLRTQETLLGEPARRPREDDVRRDDPGVFLALGHREHAPTLG